MPGEWERQGRYDQDMGFTCTNLSTSKGKVLLLKSRELVGITMKQMLDSSWARIEADKAKERERPFTQI